MKKDTDSEKIDVRGIGAVELDGVPSEMQNVEIESWTFITSEWPLIYGVSLRGGGTGMLQAPWPDSPVLLVNLPPGSDDAVQEWCGDLNLPPALARDILDRCLRREVDEVMTTVLCNRPSSPYMDVVSAGLDLLQYGYSPDALDTFIATLRTVPDEARPTSGTLGLLRYLRDSYMRGARRS